MFAMLVAGKTNRLVLLIVVSSLLAIGIYAFKVMYDIRKADNDIKFQNEGERSRQQYIQTQYGSRSDL